MTHRAPETTPLRMDVFPSGEIGIVWEDGHESFYAARDLRGLCPCAACVDEVTGRRILDPASIPEDLVPRLWNGVGHYGVQFVWSDGHSTGIYPHAMLRRVCGCDACRAQTGTAASA
jgi:DUF971 family protein